MYVHVGNLRSIWEQEPQSSLARKCVCVCVCFACCVDSSESCSRAVVTEHPNQERASVGCLRACVISLRAE